jgi:hypothetical protein
LNTPHLKSKRMKIQDYLHYYIGCKVKATPYGGQANRYIDGRLVGLNINNVAFVKFDEWQAVADVTTTCVMPILRRTADITEDEAAHLALIYSGTKTVERTKGVADNWYYYLCYHGDNKEGELLIIAADGCAWYAHYFDKEQPGYRNIINEHQAFHYLLQQQFDLFSLIDNGLAVDKNKIS